MTRRFATHERVASEQEGGTSSNRSFGIVFAVVFTGVGLVPAFRGGPVRVWCLVLAAGFLAAAVLRPLWLAPLNRWWTRLGLLLHRVVSPVVMGLIFYAVFTPIGLLLRLSGKDLLSLNWDRDAVTYWIPRHPPGPSPDTMPRQF